MSNSRIEGTFIPPQFQDGRPITHMILVCDVDGVVRKCTESSVDPRVIASIKELIADHKVDVAFISGSPITHDPFLETWRKGNITLDKAFDNLLTAELNTNRVAIYGALGGQQMTPKHQMETLEEYPLTVTFELGKLLLHAFLQEVEHDGTSQQQKISRALIPHLDSLKLENTQQSPRITAHEFGEIVLQIRSHLDPNFRLVNYGAFIETHTTNPPWNTARSVSWLKSQFDCPHLLISQLPEEQKQLAAGLSHRGKDGFNFLLVSKTNKSQAIQKHIRRKKESFPDALIVTIGDTQVDYPMHQHAHLAYHVGKEQVWRDHPLPHCKLVLDKFGRDCQHVDGTLQVLNLLKQGIGKPLLNWIGSL